MLRGTWIAIAGAALLAAVIGVALRPGGEDPSSTDKVAKTAQAAKPSKGGARPPVPVVTAAATTETFTLKRRTIGTLESPAVVVVRARIDSQVVEQAVTDGQIVRKGQLLFRLDDREIRATIARDQAQLAKDQAALAQAKGQLDRTRELESKRIASPQQLEVAEAAYAAAVQQVEADQAVLDADRLKLGYATLEAPMEGRIGSIRTAPGNLVSSGDTAGLVTITQMKPLRVSFTLPEADIAALRRAERAEPSTPVHIFTAAGGSTEPAATGVLDFVDSAVDVTSGTIAARATFPNDGYKLWPGQFVDVEIALSSRPATIMLPSSAVLMGQKGPYVFIAEADRTTTVRPVRLGGTDSGRVAVVEGLAAGERVVIEGQARLSPGSRWSEAEPAAPQSAGGKAPPRIREAEAPGPR